MSENERDSHFQEYANLVFIDLLEQDLLYLPVNGLTTPYVEIEEGVTTMREKVIHLIARRAYDLLVHDRLHTGTSDLQHAASHLEAEELVNGIPDMTELPE